MSGKHKGHKAGSSFVPVVTIKPPAMIRFGLDLRLAIKLYV